MPYIITKTNGVQLASIDDATIDTSTDLFLVGRNYSGYGRVVNENFVKLLENFASSTAPTKSLQGQLWYDSSAKSLHVYDGTNYKSLANVYIQSSTPAASSLGDFWWDTEAQQLRAFNGSSYRLIGPPTSAADKSYWVSADITPLVGTQATNTVLEGFCGASPVVVVSNDSFEPTVNNISSVFPQIYRGITLSGANPNTGVSAVSTSTAGPNGTDYILWGTAAHAINATTSDFTNGLNVTNTATGSSFYVTFADRSTDGATRAFVSSNMRYNAASNVLTTTATQAYYADLAERYEADGIYDKGTVLIIGGDKEVTTTDKYADTRVAGIVSTNPAYMMNSEAGNDETHPYIALKGRVPCKVIGTINKGDLLVTSTYPGYAAAAFSPVVGSVIGKALGSQTEGFGIIEVLVI